MTLFVVRVHDNNLSGSVIGKVEAESVDALAEFFQDRVGRWAHDLPGFDGAFILGEFEVHVWIVPKIATHSTGNDRTEAVKYMTEKIEEGEAWPDWIIYENNLATGRGHEQVVTQDGWV